MNENEILLYYRAMSVKGYLSCFSEKPALDPGAAKLWTLSANDMDDDDIVSTDDIFTY